MRQVIPAEAKVDITHAQAKIWTGQLLDPDSPLYNMAFLIDLPVSTDLQAWKDAFAQTVLESDALRTHIHQVHGRPVATLWGEVTSSILTEDLDLSDHPEPQVETKRWTTARARTLLHRSHRLFDSVLIRTGPATVVWFLNQHHAICDAVSIASIVKRTLTHYKAADSERPAPYYPTLHKLEQDDHDRAKAIEYWQGLPDPMPTAFYGQQRTALTSASHRQTLHLSRADTRRLRNIASHDSFRSFTAEMSLFITMATLKAAWLSRITGQDQVSMDCPAHNRLTPEARNTIGLFIEMFPLHLQVDAAESFQHLAEQVRQQTGSFLLHARPALPRSGHASTPQSVLNVVTATFPPIDGEACDVHWIHPGASDRDHLVRVQLHDFGGTGRFQLLLDMNDSAFTADERERAAHHLLALLSAMLDDPGQIIGACSMLADDEKTRILETFNSPSSNPPPEETVLDLFRHHCEAQPDNLAVRVAHESWTYRQIDEKSDQVASRLLASGITAGSRVAIAAGRSRETLAAIWGVLKAGAAYIPMDPRHPAERNRLILADAQPNLLIASTHLSDELSGPTMDRLDIENLFRPNLPGNLDSPDDLLADASRSPTPISPSSVCYIIYTSGSTGTPKGVPITHAGLADYMTWARRTYASDEPVTMPWFTSFSFDLTVTSLFLPLLTGGLLIIYPETEAPVDGALVDVVQDNACERIKLTPAHASLLRRMDLRQSRLKTLILGGEDLQTDLARDLIDVLGSDTVIYNEYGPTEAVVGCMIHRFDPERDTGPGVPIGKPADHVSLLILNPQSQPVPEGVPGELCISRYGLTSGYLDRPDVTRQVFVPNPFRPGDIMYRTGDLVRFSSPGVLTYLGRIDRQIKIRGHRIEPGEVESILCRMGGIAESVVRVWAPTSSTPTPPLSTDCCIKCGIEPSVPGVTLDSECICSICRDYESVRETASAYFRSPDDLRDRLDAHRGQGDYDCLVLFSGGKDSTYALAQVVELGYRVYSFTLDNGYISEDAKSNIARVVQALGVTHEFATTAAMPEIFRDSLQRFSNVCQGCFKALYTLSVNRAHALGIPVIITGLSRGQFFETRLTEHLFQDNRFSTSDVDHAVLEARKVYHRFDDAVNQSLDVSLFETDAIFDQIQFVDFYRYWDVGLEELHAYLSKKLPWIRPRDTGRSTNCLINDVGIHVHKLERGFHNYALPYSWDVRMGHKTRAEALDELNDDIDEAYVQTVLAEIDYAPRPPASLQKKTLIAYYVSEQDLPRAAFEAYLRDRLPAVAIPDQFIRIPNIPLAASGKVDLHALPEPTSDESLHTREITPPQSDVEVAVAEIWKDLLNGPAINRMDSFFDIGGQSLTAMETMYRVCSQFEIDLPLAVIFETPHLHTFASRIEKTILDDIEALDEEEAERLAEQEPPP